MPLLRCHEGRGAMPVGLIVASLNVKYSYYTVRVGKGRVESYLSEMHMHFI